MHWKVLPRLRTKIKQNFEKEAREEQIKHVVETICDNVVDESEVRLDVATLEKIRRRGT